MPKDNNERKKKDIDAGIYSSAGKFGLGTIEGLESLAHGAGVQWYDLREDPTGTLKTWAKFARNVAPYVNPLIPETEDDKAFEKNLTNSIMKDADKRLIHGDTYTRSQYISDWVFNIGSLFVGGGELSAVSKTAKASNVLLDTEKAAEIGEISKAAEDATKVEKAVNDAEKVEVASKTASETAEEASKMAEVAKNEASIQSKVTNVINKAEAVAGRKIQAVEEELKSVVNGIDKEAEKIKNKIVNKVEIKSKEIESGIKSGSSAERLKYYEKLKDGVIDDTAWNRLSKYAEKEKINLNNIPWDEKMSMIDRFKADIMSKPKSMKYIEHNANELLKLSDNRLSDCIENGYNAEDYYKILNQDKSVRNPEEYLKSLENTKLIKNWNEAFYGNDSKVVLSYMPKDAYDNFVLGYGTIGRPGENGGQFVLPQIIGDSIEGKLADLGSISNSTPEFKVQLAKELGLPEDIFANGIVRVEVPLDGGIDLHIVKGIEDGCNYQWIPGGKTLGGTTEGMIRQITKDNDTELYNTIINNVKR